MNKWARPLEWNSASAASGGGRGAPRPHHYFAFLSYSHKDESDADWLHKELERFRVPSSLAGRLTANGVIPKRLTPIFRDRHELAAADDLGAEIKEALAASRCMIVLCSPAAARSRWTNAEIETFKKVHPEGCIVAAIVAGEPFASDTAGREEEECLPAALRQKYDKRGRPTARRAEPLAADLREGRDGRRLGFLKIVAGMLGLGLDDLVQREQLRRQRRLAYIAAASLAGMAVTSTLAVTAIQARDEARDQRSEAEGMVGFMLGDLREKLEPIGRLDTLDAVGSRALAYFQNQDKSDLSDEALAQRARALALIGEIAFRRGDLQGALNRYAEASASTAEAVRRYPDDPQRLFDHAQNVFWFGYIAWQRGRADEAAARFQEYKRLAEAMIALAPANKDYRLEEFYANTNLGTVLMDQRRYRQAARTYEASLRGAEALAAAEPRNLNYQKEVINALAWLADAREYSGDLEQALATRERQLRLLEEAEQAAPNDTEIQRDAMTAHRAMGRLLASRGDVAGGVEQALASVAKSDRLFRVEPENTEWLQANSSARFDLAELQLTAGRTAEAASTIRGGCDIVDRLTRRSPSVTDWNITKRVHCLTLRARLAMRQNIPAEAASHASRALALARQSPKPIERGLLIFRSLATGSAALEALGRADQATAWARQAIGAIPSSIELRPDERAELALLQLRVGNRDAAHKLISNLAAIGYRHPAYLAAIRMEGRA